MNLRQAPKSGFICVGAAWFKTCEEWRALVISVAKDGVAAKKKRRFSSKSVQDTGHLDCDVAGAYNANALRLLSETQRQGVRVQESRAFERGTRESVLDIEEAVTGDDQVTSWEGAGSGVPARSNKDVRSGGKESAKGGR